MSRAGLAEHSAGSRERREAPSRDRAGAGRPQNPRSPPSPEGQWPSGDGQEAAGFCGSGVSPPRVGAGDGELDGAKLGERAWTGLTVSFAASRVCPHF